MDNKQQQNNNPEEEEEEEPKPSTSQGGGGERFRTSSAQGAAGVGNQFNQTLQLPEPTTAASDNLP